MRVPPCPAKPGRPSGSVFSCLSLLSVARTVAVRFNQILAVKHKQDSNRGAVVTLRYTVGKQIRRKATECQRPAPAVHSSGTHAGAHAATAMAAHAAAAAFSFLLAAARGAGML